MGRFLMKDQNSVSDTVVYSDSFREILPKYNTNNQFLLRNGFNQLRKDMGFTQIRFYCFKKKVGRVLHIITNNDANGAKVLKFFTKSDTMPSACGSFTRLPDDNSILAKNCGKWGYPDSNKWGSSVMRFDKRLYSRPFVWTNKHYFKMPLYDCDDDGKPISLGDTWQIFVR